MVKKIIAFIAVVTAIATMNGESVKLDDMHHFITKLMSRMTLDEKIGQLNLSCGGVPGVVGSAIGQEDAIRKGMVGATGGFDYNSTVSAQKIAVEQSRLHIPLLIGLDVIHGYRTIFPIPLASASSWNLELIENSARIAATEAAAYGINWTYSPMVDICRDSRWGRIAEGAGEDPYLGSCIARAMVKGYQGDDLSASNTIMACVKHIGLYGAAEGGRDYNTVELSRQAMYNYYFPPYKAAIEAGAGSGMASFNVVDGIPATGNKWLLTDVLRNQWKFDGFIVSDAGSVGEMKIHGMGDDEEVAYLGLDAGTDMDMSSSEYILHVKDLIRKKRLPMATVDASCRRILEAKYKLGLFDDPYKYTSDKDKEGKIMTSENLRVARQLATESIVLLKNSDGVLPLSGKGKIAIVGPLGNDVKQLFGTWAPSEYDSLSRSIYSAMSETVGSDAEVRYSQGSNYTEDYCIYDGGYSVPTDSLVKDAVAIANWADVVVAAVGEPCSWSGEARSRADIQLPSCQKKMLKALKGTGKPVVLLVMSGRPIALADEDRNFNTIVEAWHGGTMAGYAISDILLGRSNPSGKLTATFPRSVGQEPLYYNHLNTGRPASGFWATSKYIDEDYTPLYPFGYGLSYNKYVYGSVTANKTELRGDDDRLIVSVPVTNTGQYEGQEVVELYVRDEVASISRPVLELKGFRKLALKPGETRNVQFDVTPEMLKFYDSELKYDWETGKFQILIGPNSSDTKAIEVNWSK